MTKALHKLCKILNLDIEANGDANKITQIIS